MPSEYRFRRTEGLTCGESAFLKSFAPSTLCGEDFNIAKGIGKADRFFPTCAHGDAEMIAEIAESLVGKGLLRRGRGKGKTVYRLTEDGERAWYGLVGGKKRAMIARLNGYKSRMGASMRRIDE